MIAGSLIVLQARMASTRLPGKAVRHLAGRSLLARCLTRLLAGEAAPVVLATTTNSEDDALAREAEALGVQTVRGPEDDVLGRFVLASSSMDTRYVIRATADNPAVDIDAARRVLRVLVSSHSDYVVEHNLPHGAAVEAVSVEALRTADRLATAPADREHVTTFVKRARRDFKVIDLEAPRQLRRPDLRFTVDTLEDLQYMDAVLSSVSSVPVEPPLWSVIDAADRMASRAVCA
ncbi:MAG: NTP transferase domain-containing protein [Acidobacteria bacterium]|nr:NTP transferase domain-containing protein [Acidobacteriota bacterium]